MNQTTNTPLSDLAESRLRKLNFRFFKWQLIIVALLAFIAVLIAVCNAGAAVLHFPPFSSWSGFGKFVLWSTSVVATCYAFMLLFLPVYFKIRKNIFRNNQADHAMSMGLNQTLTQLTGVPLQNYPIMESQLGGSWRLFRVEHVASQLLQGSFTSDFNIAKWIFGGAQPFQGRTYQLSTANLIDTSSLMFLENEQGETMRVVVPSPVAILSIVKGWISDVMLKLRYDHYDYDEKSHTEAVLETFSYADWMQTPLEKATVIDKLNVELQESKAGRTTIEVFGKEVRPGIVFASKLVVGGKEALCFPSGFLQRFANQIESNCNVQLELAEVTTN